MFVAWRDLRFATGRFVLIGAVVALITLLVGFLSGLTAGLAEQNISATLALPGDRIALSMPEGESPSFSDSAVTEKQAEIWADSAGIRSVEPLGIVQAKLSTKKDRTSVALFGSNASLSPAVPQRDGEVTLSETTAADLSVGVGDTVSIVGSEYTIDSIVADSWYSHTAVARMTMDDWQLTASKLGSAATYATALVIVGADADYSELDELAGTSSNSVLLSLLALPAFRSEIGSLLLIVAMLFAISALVVGAFFTVWSIQRKPDFAVLKALGASNRTLHSDALGQAALLLVVGVGAGIGLTAALGAFAQSELPFVLSPLTTVLPGLAMIAFGLAGAAIATQSVAKADPLTALGSSR